MPRSDRDRVVYSSEKGRVCGLCGLPQKRCACRANPRGTVLNTDGDGVARVSRSSKGRRGKTVTIISGLPGRAEELSELARDLKRLCGTGGAVKEGVIEIQGDRRDQIMEELARRQIPAKRAGG